MSNKSKFLNSAKLAIASIVLTSSLASCKMMCKHDCASKANTTKEEKAKCSSKGKVSKSSKTKEGKTSCASKKAE